MPGIRSRQGCDECRRRRRKCDEQKPCCGHCAAYSRACKYTLRVVWQNENKEGRGEMVLHKPQLVQSPPQQLPNGIPLSARYQRLLGHFTRDILASLSCHPSVHQDLRQGLLPATLESPQLMSACLALSAAGLLSRGVADLDGVGIAKILGHLQSSGLALLRSALGKASTTTIIGNQQRETNAALMATCLIWCLTDVFTYRRFEGALPSSWRIHLKGIQALLDKDNGGYFVAYLPTTTDRASIHTAMKHLYQLYLSLQTLPYIPQASETDAISETRIPPILDHQSPIAAAPTTSPAIDGFLGYSDELLYILHQINQLSHQMRSPVTAQDMHIFEADIVLGKIKAMILRDAKATPPVTLCTTSSSLITEPSKPPPREYVLCHQIFQQATLIQAYRQLYRLPSGSRKIQSAFDRMLSLFGQMEEDKSDSGSSSTSASSRIEPCHTWVAMAMPLFTMGCESVTLDQRRFVLDKVDGLGECIRSSHVRIIRQALVDVWGLRAEVGDERGELCSAELLEKLDYNIILF